jgi:cellulose synthase operon protein YhjQ
MGLRGAELDDRPTADSTPEDVAALYAWAQLQGAKYRDYSALRREYRAQVRYRTAKMVLERELKAQAEAEAKANEAERAAMAAAESVRWGDPDDRGAALKAEEAAQKAAAERLEAARRVETAASAAMVVMREEREIAEAHASAQRQASVYAEAEQRRRRLAGPAPDDGVDEADEMLDNPAPIPSRKEAARERAASGGWLGPAVEVSEAAAETPAELEPASPAWLHLEPTPPRKGGAPPIAQLKETAVGEGRAEAIGGDTLQDSREWVAARWFALKDVFADSGPALAAIQPLRPGAKRMPLLAVYSLAGGVGKTSLVATLGRALAEQGEKVVLTDTTSQGLLPVYFGRRDLPPGVVRSGMPPAQGSKLPISLVAYDASGAGEDERLQRMLTGEILRHVQGNHRLLLDLPPGASWLLGRMAELYPTVLVPLAPDMNSVISLQAVERLFRAKTDASGRPMQPYYVLNQFDAALALHLDVREVLRRQLGDRLLRVAIRRSPAVSEALAEGMTVLDYAPDAPVAQDYREVVSWLKSISPPATAESRRVRRGEL